MEVQKIDVSNEKLLLASIITNNEVITKLHNLLNDKNNIVFTNRHASLIANICVKYYNKFGSSPGVNILNLVKSWCERNEDDKNSSLLLSLIQETLNFGQVYNNSSLNVEYITSIAYEQANRNKLEKLKENIESLVDGGKISEALNIVESFTKCSVQEEGEVDPFKNQDIIKQCLDDDGESIIKYPEPLASFFGRSLEREGFIAFMAPDKSGKSFWLLDLAFRACCQRNRVAFFEAGDMSIKQLMRRLLIRVAKQPRFPKTVKIPERFVLANDDFFVEYKEVEFKDKLDWKTAWSKLQQLAQTKIRSQNSYLKIACYPNSTLSIKNIKAKLDEWKRREGWEADVVIIDYADILAPVDNKDDSREQINKNWKLLRALSQEGNKPLVITATQSNARGYAAEVLSRKEFSEDKRKLAHVTGMIGINVTPYDKEKGICRLNWIVRREEFFDSNKTIKVAGCLDLANPAVISSF